MSSKESRKKCKIEYQGTIAPVVGKLMNQCRGMDREFRIVSEKMLQEEKKEDNPNRMTIVVIMDTGAYIRHYWG